MCFLMEDDIIYEVILEKTKQTKKSQSDQDSRINIQFKENTGYIAICWMTLHRESQQDHNSTG